MNLKRQTFTISCTNLPKKERMTKYGNLSPQNKKHFLLRKYHVTLGRTKAVTYSSQVNVQLSLSEINTLLSTTSILSLSLMAYKTTDTIDKLACTNYVDFGKSQDRSGQLSLTEIDFNFLDIKLIVFKWADKNAEIQPRQNITMGEVDVNKFIRQRNQLVAARNIFLREQNLPPVLQSTLSKDMEEQLKLVDKVTDIAGCPRRRICVTMLRYKVDNPETSYAQVRLFGRMTEEENFQKIVYVN